AAAALAATSALTACGGGSGSADEGGGDVTVTMAVQTPQSGEGAFRPMVAAFEKANPTIDIDLVETPTDSYANVLRTQLQGGNAPDVFYGTAGRGNLNAVLSLGEAGFVEPLTGEAWAEAAVPPSATSLYVSDGELYALPVDLVPASIVVNNDTYAELGLPKATTFAELLQQCRTLAGQGKSEFAIAGSAGPNLGMHALQLAASTVYSADPDWNAKRQAGSVTFAGSPEWQSVMTKVVQMNEAGCYQEGAVGAGFGEITQAVAGGAALGLFAPAGAASDLATGNPGKQFGQAVLPGDTAEQTRLSVTPSNALAISAESQHKDAARKVLEFFAEPANQDAVAVAGGNLSLAAVGGGTVPADLADLTPFLDDESKQVPLGNLAWPNGNVYDVLGSGIQGLLTGQATPEQVLTSMDQAWDQGS
ncbi:extracellular solute-binding protein, partial [Kineococcus sp. R8]|uniref:ABC transporter substrate-binding protein n=1 Tax=Kineococcus siccus TaxID=2696567 RepID=UPI001411CD4E